MFICSPGASSRCHSAYVAQRGQHTIGLLCLILLCVFKQRDHHCTAQPPSAGWVSHLPWCCTRLLRTLILKVIGVQEVWSGSGDCTDVWHLLLPFLPHCLVATESWPQRSVHSRQFPEAQLCFYKAPSPTVLTADHKPQPSPCEVWWAGQAVFCLQIFAFQS